MQMELVIRFDYGWIVPWVRRLDTVDCAQDTIRVLACYPRRRLRGNRCARCDDAGKTGEHECPVQEPEAHRAHVRLQHSVQRDWNEHQRDQREPDDAPNALERHQERQREHDLLVPQQTLATAAHEPHGEESDRKERCRLQRRRGWPPFDDVLTKTGIREHQLVVAG